MPGIVFCVFFRVVHRWSIIITCCSLAVKKIQIRMLHFLLGAYAQPQHHGAFAKYTSPPKKTNIHKKLSQTVQHLTTIMPLHHDILLKVSPISPKRCSKKNNILDFLTDINPIRNSCRSGTLPVATARWSSSKVSPGKSCKICDNSHSTELDQKRMRMRICYVSSIWIKNIMYCSCSVEY